MTVGSRPFSLHSVLLGIALILPAAASAQIGVTTDVITGVVTAEGGRPLAGADVLVYSFDSQITRTVRTDARGRYTVVFPDGGGQYRVTVRFIGMQPVQGTIQRAADEDRLVFDVRLSNAPITLEAITVQARPQPVRVPDPPTPGSVERALSSELLARLPVDQSDLSLLAALAPGVLSLGQTDSSAAAFSVAGLRPDANAITVDGLTFSGALPQDALRTTRVVTSTYDVSRGEFSGGLIASTTRSGTNRVQGSSNYALRDDNLAVAEDDTSAFSQGFNQNQLSAGLGGPLVRDRLFYFVSGQARLRDDASQTLLSATPLDLARLGVAPDSVTRFLSVVSGLGVVPTTDAPTGARSTDDYSALLRFDYLLSNDHTLTLRGDWRNSSQDPSRLSPLALPQTAGRNSSAGGGAMVVLTSRFGVHLLNEARTYLSGSRRDADAFLALPAGRVLVTSALPDGAQGATTLTFGGSTSMPTRSRATSLEASDEVSWLPGGGRHRVRLGALLDAARSTDLVSSNSYGTYGFNSLTDLEQNRPASFRRTLAPSDRSSYGVNAAGYLGDVWRTTARLQLTYGARLEWSAFRHAPPYDAAVDSLFGRRTDQLPSEWHASPRAGFTWTPGLPPAGSGGGAFRQAPWIVRGGVGEFRSPIPTDLVAATQSSTGLAASEAQIVCVGANVPTPDWTAYLGDSSAVPSQCAGGPGLPPPNRNVAVFAPGFQAPRAWRGSLGVDRSVTDLLRLSLNASYARGVSQYGFRDLNLIATPRFTLADEGGRPVYVDPSLIAITGAVPLSGSRVDPRFGQVLEIGSDLASDTRQVTVGLNGVTHNGALLQLSYTWTRARDQSSASRFGTSGFGSVTTAGDPNVREWATSDYDRRHAFLATVTYPFGPALEITSIARLASGAPYTPLVGSDINGDGARNDRAFVFDPAGASPAAAAMGRLLAEAAPRVRDCLEQQLGQVAARNSCRGPWQAAFDLQLNYRPRVLGLDRRLMLSVVTVNLLRGIDDLVHGSANAHGWGLTLRPDPTLLYVTGFDSTSRRFSYAVNERFGATGSGANALRTPFQIGVQLRMTIGPDRTREALDALRGGGGGGGFSGRGGGGGGRFGAGGGGAGGGDLADRFQTLLPNPAAAVLELKDSLGLTGDEVGRLEGVRDTVYARFAAIADTIRKLLANEGANPDPTRVMSLLRPRFEAGREQVRQALEQVRAILTPEQWQRVPERIRTPRSRPGAAAPPG